MNESSPFQGSPSFAHASFLYRVFAAMIPNEVPLDTGDFRLMSRRVIVALRELRETHRFVRGMVAWIGFKQTEVLYDRPGRFAGETKYPLRKMVRFAIDSQNLSYYHSQESIPISELKPFGYVPGGSYNGQTLPKTGSIPDMVQRDTHSIFANVEFNY